MAFPRLNALSYWLYAFAGLVFCSSFFASGGAANTGWTAYPPLSLEALGNGQDLWILSIHILTISSAVGAVNFIVTIHNMRTRGMSWMRIPLFVWSVEVYAWLLIVVLPVLSAGLTMLLLERQFPDTFHFFRPEGSDAGGSPILFQHVFWFFGHPEVYIMVLPVFGIISEVIPVFARKPIFGYKAVAFSTVAIGFFSMLVWAHHMFAVGMPTYLNIWFMLASMVIAVPTGMKIFNWLATLWRGNISLETPMLFCLGFLSVFTIGGLSGIYLAAFPVDWQVTDTYFVVAHFHYVLFGGSMLGMIGGLWYWWPKIFGRFLYERLGKWTFVADLRRLQRDVLPAAPARSARHAAARLHVPPRRAVGGLQHDLDDRLVHHGARLPRLPRRDREERQRAPRRERPVAGGHARVVHDVAAAAAQLRRGAVRHERAAPVRPPPQARGRRVCEDRAAHPGRCCGAAAAAAALAAGVVVASARARARRGALGCDARRAAAPRRGARRRARRVPAARRARRRRARR